jgi:hypothetical protein
MNHFFYLTSETRENMVFVFKVQLLGGKKFFLFLEKKFPDDSGKRAPNGLEDRPA